MFEVLIYAWMLGYNSASITNLDIAVIYDCCLNLVMWYSSTNCVSDTNCNLNSVSEDNVYDTILQKV